MFAIPFNPSGALTWRFERTHPSLDVAGVGVAGATPLLFVVPLKGHGVDHGSRRSAQKLKQLNGNPGRANEVHSQALYCQ